MKKINNIKRGPVANCVVLHDFAYIPESIKDWFEYTVSFFRKYGIEPTRMDSQKTSRTVSMKIGIKQLEEVDYKTDGMWIGATPPNHSIDMFDGIFRTTLEFRRKTTLVLCFDDQIAPFHSSLVCSLTKDLSSFFDARYGYAYQRQFGQGPDLYPFGVLSGLDSDKDEEEREQINIWGLKYGSSKYHLGQLRDIYPYNFLSQAHLDNKIGNQSLHNWIKSEQNRGELTPLTQTLWCWSLTPEQIATVHESLKSTGLLICV